MGSSVILPAPGQPTEGPDPNFVSASRPRVVDYIRHGLQPPSPYYLTQDDTIVIQVMNSKAGITPSVSFRYVDAITGALRFAASNITPPSTKLAQTFPFVLGEVFLLSMSVGNGGVALQAGQCFVVGAIERGFPNSAINAGILFADYLTGQNVLGWPGGRIVHSGEGPGFRHTITVVNPAAGADWSTSVPANTRWRLQSFSAQLNIANAGVARNVRVVVNDATPNQVWICAAQQTGAINTNVKAVGSPFNVTSVVDTTILNLPLPAPTILPAGYAVATSTININVADQWQAITLDVEEWLEM